MRLTLKLVNAEIKSRGGDEKLFKGEGYYYFADTDRATAWEGVYVYRLNELTLEQWIEEWESRAKPVEAQDGKLFKPAGSDFIVKAKIAGHVVYLYQSKVNKNSFNWTSVRRDATVFAEDFDIDEVFSLHWNLMNDGREIRCHRPEIE